MTAEVLIDLRGLCRVASSDGKGYSAVGEALQNTGNSPVYLLTDWGPGAVCGCKTVDGQASTAAAILEKQLRDQGEIDEIARIQVHQSRTSMGSTTVAFTAVPVKTWQQYHQMAQQHAQLVLVYDWVSAMLEWCKKQGHHTGTLLLVQPEGLMVLVIARDQIRILDRLAVFHDETDPWSRLGQHVVSMVREQDDAVDGAGVLPSSAPVLLWSIRGTEAALAPLIQGLAPLVCTEVWAEDPPAAAAGLQGCAAIVHGLEWQGFVSALPLAKSASRPVDKAAVWADRWLPSVAMAGIGLSCIMGATAAFMHYKTQLGLAGLSGDDQKTRTLWQSLNTQVQQAEQLSGQQKDIRDWVQQRLQGSKLPDMAQVLVRVRRALPSGVVIDEVGFVVDKGNHLISVVGHAAQMDDALRSETAFAQALQADGFTLQKRDVLLQDGRPKFKLSMTWSNS